MKNELSKKQRISITILAASAFILNQLVDFLPQDKFNTDYLFVPIILFLGMIFGIILGNAQRNK